MSDTAKWKSFKAIIEPVPGDKNSRLNLEFMSPNMNVAWDYAKSQWRAYGSVMRVIEVKEVKRHDQRKSQDQAIMVKSAS